MLKIYQFGIIDVTLFYDAEYIKMDYFTDGNGVGRFNLFPNVLDK